MIKKRLSLFAILLSILFLISACTEKESSYSTTSESEKGDFILVSGDTVSEQAGCVLASRFTVGEKIVFRMNAIDSNTNKQLEDAKLKVHLSTGEVLDMTLGQHGEGPDAKFWTAAYVVTEDTPKGTMTYYVTAEDGERKGEFKPFNVQPSLITIIDPNAPAIGQPEGAEEETEKKEA